MSVTTGGYVMKILGVVFHLLLALLSFSSSCLADDAKGDTFRAEGERWFVEPGALNSYDSRLADKDLKVKSETGRIGYAQPAWIGKNPGDIGRLWVIEDEKGKTIAECERDYPVEMLRCVSTTGEPMAEDVDQ